MTADGGPECGAQKTGQTKFLAMGLEKRGPFRLAHSLVEFLEVQYGFTQRSRRQFRKDALDRTRRNSESLAKPIRRCLMLGVVLKVCFVADVDMRHALQERRGEA